VVGGAVILAAVVAVHAVAGPAGAATTFTGCLTKNQGIVDIAPGDQPGTPCKVGQPVVHIGSGDIAAVNTPAGGGLRGGAVSGDVSLSLAPIPAARVKGTVSLLIPDNTFTLIPLDQEEFDTADLHDPADNTRLTAPVAGIYAVSANVAWPFNSQGTRELFIEAHIGIAFQRVASSVAPASSIAVQQSVSTIIQLSAGDSVQLEVRQATGNHDNIEVNDGSPTLAMAWLGPSS
jgi:hypothetical protein